MYSYRRFYLQLISCNVASSATRGLDLSDVYPLSRLKLTPKRRPIVSSTVYSDIIDTVNTVDSIYVL